MATFTDYTYAWVKRLRDFTQDVLHILEAMEEGPYGYLDDSIRSLRKQVETLQEQLGTQASNTQVKKPDSHVT